MQNLNKLCYYSLVPMVMLEFKHQFDSYYFNSLIIKDGKLMKNMVSSIKNAKILKLIYRGTRDGFKSVNFRIKCG